MRPSLSIPNSLHIHVGSTISFLDDLYILDRDKETRTYFVNMVIDNEKVQYPLDHGDVVGIFNEKTNTFDEKELSRHDNKMGLTYEPWIHWIEKSLMIE